MMSIQEVIARIEETLHIVFAEIDQWFDKPEVVRNYRPADQGWTIHEILEHISLTSHYLLKLIDKGAVKALKNSVSVDVTKELEHYSFDWDKLEQIGKHQSFAWIRPGHMEPGGKVSVEEIRNILQTQKNRCIAHLQSMPQGEGILHQTTMSVNNLGKIDVYAYIYFLAKHAQRHIAQMEKNEAEMMAEKSKREMLVQFPFLILHQVQQIQT